MSINNLQSMKEFNVTTSETAPGSPPFNLIVFDIKSERALIYFNKSKNPNGIITSHEASIKVNLSLLCWFKKFV